MTRKTPYLVRVFVPENPTIYGFFGAGAGLFGDLANFLSEKITAGLLLILFLGGAGVAAAFCVAKAMKVEEKTEAQAIAVGKCLPCDAFRAASVAALIYLLLMIVGGGQSATQSVGEMLGLIKEDVEQISEDVSVIRESVDSLTIVEKPKTAFDSFNNAWVYQFVRRDSAKAFDWIRKHYETVRPSKLDAAELYFTTGRVTVPRDALIAEMAALGRKNRDAALLVIAARNEPDAEKSNALYAEARSVDPDFPFAYWDMQRVVQPVSGQPETAAETMKRLAAQKAGMDAFLEKIDGQPAAAYFYLPQHQADYETLARQQSASLAGNIASYERIVQNTTDRENKLRAEKMTPPPLQFSWRDNVSKDLLQIEKTFVVHAQRYAYRFNGGEWIEGDRIPLYHEQPRRGVFELRWQDRQTGEWFGPFRYDYSAG